MLCKTDFAQEKEVAQKSDQKEVGHQDSHVHPEWYADIHVIRFQDRLWQFENAVGQRAVQFLPPEPIDGYHG